MFSTSFIDFEKVFKESDIASNVNWPSLLGMSSIKVPRSSLCGEYLLFNPLMPGGNKKVTHT